MISLNDPAHCPVAPQSRSIKVMRDHGHPWDSRPGFDLMIIDALTESDRDAAVKLAEGRFWAVWLSGFDASAGDTPSAVLYKPSGINRPWCDSPHAPHPGCREGIELDLAARFERARG
ncbi:MAG: hypothetical protein Q7V53_02985 [Caldisericota bacterium]|nr:hypothetical protein [Caldisericota bacterium]